MARKAMTAVTSASLGQDVLNLERSLATSFRLSRQALIEYLASRTATKTTVLQAFGRYVRKTQREAGNEPGRLVGGTIIPINLSRQLASHLQVLMATADSKNRSEVLRFLYAFWSSKAGK